MSRLPYRPEIDGLRALAVIPVVLFHTQLGFPGGFVGVDVFFVISGFLITSLLLAELRAGTFSFAGFWERRIRRIAPAAAVTVAVSLVIGYFLLLPADFADLGRSAVAQALLAANFHFHQAAGYFSAPAESKPLLHFWSLAVEEQFYLLLPVILVLVWRWRRTRLLGVVGGLSLASFGLSCVGVYGFRDATFYLLPGRAWELGLGALLAIGGARLSIEEKWREPFGWLGVALIVWPMAMYAPWSIFPGPAALAPCFGTALIIWSTAHGRGLLQRLLSWRPLVFVGLISYSLYLWHWPVQVYSHYWLTEESPLLARLAVLALSLGLAWASWRWIERPFRQRRVGRGRKVVFGSMAGATAAMVATGAYLSAQDGLPQRLDPEIVQYAAAYEDRPVIEEADLSLESAERGELTPIHAESSAQAQVLLWGDSHARVVSPAIEAMCRKFGTRGWRASKSRTPSLLEWGDDEARRYNRAIFAWIEQHRPAAVILASRWEASLLEDDDADALQRTVQAVRDLGVSVWIMRQVPFQGVDVPRSLARAALVGEDVKDVGVTVAEHTEITRQSNAIIDRVVASAPWLRVLDPLPYLSRDGLCFAEYEGKALYYDRQHLTITGAGLLEPMFEPMFPDLRSPRRG